jgi:uncharacterized membrane protein YdjX (TVP38/TMEM64 family)
VERRAFRYLAAGVVSGTTGVSVWLSAAGLRAPLSHQPQGLIAILAGSVAALFVFRKVAEDAAIDLTRKGERALEAREVLDFLSKQAAGYLLIPMGGVLVCLAARTGSVSTWAYTAGGFLGSLLGYGLARAMLRPKRSLIQRGTEVMREPAAVERAIREHEAYLKRIGDPGIQLGPCRIETEAAKGHILILGATRTGKSLISWSLIRSVVEGFKPGEDKRAVIFDAKQDTLSRLSGLRPRCPIVTMNPFDRRAYAWKIAADIRNPAGAQRVSVILVPLNPQLTQQHWEESLRGLVEELVIAFISDESTRDVWTFRDLVYAATNRARAVALLRRTPTGRDFIEMSLTDEEHALNVMATVAAKLRPFRIIAALWDTAEREGRSLSLAEWRRRQMILVLGNAHELREAMRTVNQMLFCALSQTMLEMPNDESRENWVFLDEVRQAGRLGHLTDLMVEGASKGVKVVMCFQDDKGLDEVYGRNLSAELSGQCHTIVVTKLNQEETAEHASKKFGEVEVWERRGTTAGGAMTGRWELERKPAVMPSEIMRLPTPSRRNGTGVSAFYLSPIGAYRYTLSPEFLDSQGWAPDATVPDFVPQGEESQYLKPWDEADLKRLRLESAWLSSGREPRRAGKLYLKSVGKKAANA